MGLEKLFLLTTRTADWFVQRGFSKCAADAIPERRRARINLARGSKYYLKYLNDSSPHLVGSTFSLLETSDLPQ
jgi:amino-acid N-acetyltransferase